MQKIIFNPGGATAVRVSSALETGQKAVGPLGLLDELELRAGLSGVWPRQDQRLIGYAAALQQALGQGGAPFYAQSFAKDRLGTAAVLLAWRDSLVKYGWPAAGGPSGCPRLDDLAAVEAHFDLAGEADRWRRLLEAARQEPILEPGDRIEVRCPKDRLDPLQGQLLDALAQGGVQVSYAPEAVCPDADRVDLLKFDNDAELALWLGQQAFGPYDVVVTADASAFDLQLMREGKPRIGDEHDGIGAIMQLFTLGLGLFHQPLDLDLLLAYLQLPRSPLQTPRTPGKLNDDQTTWWVCLTNTLTRCLLSQNGLGARWQQLVDEAVYDREGNKLQPAKLAECRLFVNQWDRVSGQGDGCRVRKDEIERFAKALKKWALAQQFDQRNAVQYNALAARCDSLLLLLDTLCANQTELATRDLMQWVRQLSRPVALAAEAARQGSVTVCRSVDALCGAAGDLYWVCSTPEYTFNYELEFLSPAEADSLRQAGLAIPSREDCLRARRARVLDALASVGGRIRLLECRILGAAAPVEDPVAVELRCLHGLKSLATAPDRSGYETSQVAGPAERSKQYQLPPGTFAGLDQPAASGGLRRERESYSSLDTLIQRPFDYVLEYFKKWRPYGRAAMDDVDTVKGTLAHAYVEHLVNTGQANLADMRRLHDESYDQALEDLARSCGLKLLLEENLLAYQHFKARLDKSVRKLFDFIDHNRLQVTGSEYKAEACIRGIGLMEATIDLLLCDAQGRCVVVDFKWSENKNYREKLEQNRALQLAVYKAVLEQSGKQVRATVYFLLPNQELLSSDVTLGGVETVNPHDTADLMQLAANSYAYRMEQLRSGLIEEGEGLGLADLQYQQDQLSLMLYPLEHAYEQPLVKKTAYGDKNRVLKGRLDE